MKYEIIRQPYIFMETMELLHKHVNGIRFSSLLSPRREPVDSPLEQLLEKRLTILQQILDEVCQNIDASDPLLRRYFEYVETDKNYTSAYLARFAISAFMDYKHTGFDETVQDILEEWETMNARGTWLKQDRGACLQHTSEPGSPGDLFAQVCAMEDLPAEFRLKLYGALYQFPETMQELAALMRPVAAVLEQTIRKADLPFDEMADYWLRSHLPPLEFLVGTMGESTVAGAGEWTRIGIGLMNANQIFYGMQNEPGRQRDCNFMYIGCCIFTHSLLREQAASLEEVSIILRSLSERRRLDILRRLAKTSCYGLELAEVMNMDRGNVSRLLSVLHSQGFLRQEKENHRIYYRADRAAVQSFFDRVLDEIFG